MHDLSAYTKKINSFGKALDKLLADDFPADAARVSGEIENHLYNIQY